jgi:hypothetical protein
MPGIRIHVHVGLNAHAAVVHPLGRYIEFGHLEPHGDPVSQHLGRVADRAVVVADVQMVQLQNQHVLGAMAVLAVGTKSVLTAIGGLLFLGSDTVLAWERFVKPIRGGPVIVIVSYHLAQALIILGLIAGS